MKVIALLVFIFLVVNTFVFSQKSFYHGPRLGATLFTGETADILKNDYDSPPILSQFGYQFEFRYYFEDEEGSMGVLELMPLFAGAEQNIIVPSLSTIIGYRNISGWEFGVGPNISPSGSSIAVAVGYSFRKGNLLFPINLAWVPSENGARYTFLFGFNI
jgi:hypothetical protein